MDRRNNILYYIDSERESVRAYYIGQDTTDGVAFANLRNPTDIRFVPREKLVNHCLSLGLVITWRLLEDYSLKIFFWPLAPCNLICNALATENETVFFSALVWREGSGTDTRLIQGLLETGDKTEIAASPYIQNTDSQFITLPGQVGLVKCPASQSSNTVVCTFI